MTPTTTTAQRAVIPQAWRPQVQSALQSDENALGFLEVDLDESLRFAKSAVILTDRRLLTCDGATNNCQGWDLQPDDRLTLADHAGVCSLEFFSQGCRQKVWRFTLGLQPSAIRLLSLFEQRQSHETDGQPLQTLLAGSVCPVCQAPLDEGADECCQAPRASNISASSASSLASRLSVARR